MQTRRWSLLILSVIVAHLLLMACSQPIPVTPTSTPEDTIVIVVTATPTPVKDKLFVSRDPTVLTLAVPGDAETLDPALAYEVVSEHIIQNTYDTLVFYNREKPNEFVPQLSTEVPTVENGGISADGKTYTFTIRRGVKFHDGTEMTPEDVAFSFWRGLLQGGSASPQWLYYEALFGSASVPNLDITDLVNPDGSLLDNRDELKKQDPAKLEAACQRVKDAITVNGDTVVFHLAQPWGPMLATIAQPWGSIQSRAWVAANGGWDGGCKTWQNFYGVTSEEINQTKIGSSENGTGPYILDHWTLDEEIALKANENYWRTEPAWEGGPSGVPRIKMVVRKIVSEFGTQLVMMQVGDADFFVPAPANYSQADLLVGEECTADGQCTVVDPDKPLRVFRGLPTNGRSDVFLNFRINTDGGNNFIGSGKLDGKGIPPDFFGDVHIRRAFAYCFDWETYIKDALNGEAVQAYNVMLPDMIGYNPNSPHYSFDLEKCRQEFEASTLRSEDGRRVMEIGFRMAIAFNTGNINRQTVAGIFQDNLMEVNENFVVEMIGLPWPTFLRNQRDRKFPIFITGWVEDIHDPHNWVVPYSIGTLGGRQGIPQELTDQFKDIILHAVLEPDPARRAEIYQEFNRLFYEQVPTILLSVALGRHYEQRWVEGYYYNPIYVGDYYHALSKK